MAKFIGTSAFLIPSDTTPFHHRSRESKRLCVSRFKRSLIAPNLYHKKTTSLPQKYCQKHWFDSGLNLDRYDILFEPSYDGGCNYTVILKGFRNGFNYRNRPNDTVDT